MTHDQEIPTMSTIGQDTSLCPPRADELEDDATSARPKENDTELLWYPRQMTIWRHKKARPTKNRRNSI
jgi:hypothetical protein